MKRKINRSTSSKQLAEIRAVRTQIPDQSEFVDHRDEQVLSQTDKLVWAYKEDLSHRRSERKPEIFEIVTVAYVTTINGKDYTVIYYDSTHDDKLLHLHVYKSMQDSTDTIIPLRVRKDGDQSRLLSWALKDIRNKWYFHRRGFYKRSKLKAEF